MSLKEEHEALLIAQREGHLVEGQTSEASQGGAASAPRKMGLGQKLVVVILLSVVTIPPAAGFYSYFSGVPLHLFAGKKEDIEDMDDSGNERSDASSTRRIALVYGQAHTV